MLGQTNPSLDGLFVHCRGQHTIDRVYVIFNNIFFYNFELLVS